MIDKVVAHTKCFGCEACSNICPKSAIEMTQNADGFFVPFIDYSLCISCSLCIKSCPSINKYSSVPNLFDVYSGRTKDDCDLYESTSGGFFSVLSDKIIESGGYICGAIFDDSFRVKHVVTNNKQIRNKMRGAKYVQSRILMCYKEIKGLLQSGKPVLFTGTSCQVHGLNLFLGKNYDNLYTVDIICHGVPPPLYFSNYLLATQKKYGEIETFRFRSKRLGWRGNNVEITLKNGKVLSNSHFTKKYTNLFGSGLLMRDTCFECPYTTVFRIGDISIGDFWGIENTKSIFNDNKGCSLIFINSKKGQHLKDAVESNFVFEDRKVPEILQHNLLFPTKKPKNISKLRKEFAKTSYWNKR